MGQSARIYNLITLVFLLMSCVAAAVVGFLLSQPPPQPPQRSIVLPTAFQLPTLTPTFTPTNTLPPTPTPLPSDTPLPSNTPSPIPTLLPSQPTNTPSPTPPSAFETLQALQTQIVLTNSALSAAQAAELAVTAAASTRAAIVSLPTSAPTVTFTPSATITPTPFIEPTSPASPTRAQPAGPTPTFTLPPTLPPLITGPTESPFPFAARDQVIFTQNFANTAGCSWQGVGGQVFDLNGQPLTNIRVHVFGSGVDLFAVSGSNTLYGASGWEIQLGNSIAANSYIVELQSAQGTIISPQVAITFPADCARNLAVVNFVQTRPF
jgi:hypothetical protein